MKFHVEWSGVLDVGEGGVEMDFDAALQVEAIQAADTYDALDAMVAKLEASELPDELLTRLEDCVYEARKDAFIDGAELTYDLMKEEGL